MKSNNKLKVVNALDLLQEVLYAFFDEKIKKAPDENWLKEITKPVQNQIKKQRKKKKLKTEEEIASKLLYEDLYALLTVIDAKWDQLNPILGLQNGDRASIIESLEFRNQLSHTRDLSLKETKRALETISFLLNSIKTTSESDNCIPLNIEKYILDIEKEQEEVERLQYQEKARREILDTPVSEAEEARIRKEHEELLKCIHFENAYLLKQALIHTSYKHEKPKLSKGEDNEQLEFLGDALLTFLSGDFLYKNHRDLGEGDMTKLRSNLVDKPQLANFARELNLGKWMLLSNGEESTGGRNKDSLLSNCFEAVIGAYYIDSGIEAVRNFVNPLFEKILDNLPTTEDSTPEIKDDVKGRLQQFVCSSKFSHNPNKQPPIYETIRSGGTDHEPEHTSVVSIAGIPYAEGKGRNGKEAEKQAAENALKILDVPSKK